MTQTRVTPVLIAVVAIAALDVTVTSLEGTLTTDPDEEINPDWDRLPIGEGDAASIKEETADGDGEGEANQATESGDVDEVLANDVLHVDGLGRLPQLVETLWGADPFDRCGLRPA